MSISKKNGAVCSDDFNIKGKTNWRSAINWSGGGSLARSVLEQMYSMGDLIVHHKRGTRRYYDLARRNIPHEILDEQEPFPDDFAHQKWRVIRRIGAMGLVWNRQSGAWLNIWNLSTSIRREIFRELLAENVISELSIEGLNTKVIFFWTSDLPLVDKIKSESKFMPRCELIAPLDPIMWDKKFHQGNFWDSNTYGKYIHLLRNANMEHIHSPSFMENNLLGGWKRFAIIKAMLCR